MANNIVGGAPNSVVAKQTISFVAAGINAANTSIIYLTDLTSKSYKSYVPGRGINAISGFVADAGYIIIAITDMDLSAIVVPPVGSSASAAPAITQQPIPQTINQGQTISLFINATGALPLTYQWQKDNVNLSGQTTSSLSISNAQPGNSGGYRCVVTNANGTTTSSTVTVTVNVITTLATPANFTNSVISPTQINLDWDNVPNATNYVLQRAQDAGFNTGLSTIYSGSVSAFNDTTVDSTVTNFYRVRADATGYNASSYASTYNSTFDPATLTGQRAIYEAEPANVTLVSGDVSQWNDASGNGFNIPQTSAGSRPAYITSGGPNNKNYLHFSSGDYMDLLPGPITTSPVSYYMVVRVVNFVNNAYIILWGVTNGADGLQMDTNAKELFIYTGQDPYYGPRSNPAYRTGWMLLKVVINDSKNIQLEVNDEPYVEPTSGTGGIPVTAFDRIGIRLDGDIVAMRVFNRKLSDSEDQNLKNYMMSKYAVQPPAKVMIAFGDSHTFGVKSGTPDGPTYMQLLTQTTSMFAYNYGVSGSVMDPFSTGQTAGVNLADKYTKWNKTRYNNCWVHFQYGTNDAAISNVTGWSNIANWKASYKAKIQTYISAGFDPNKIIICTPPYSTAVYPNPSPGRLAQFITPITEIASELGIHLCDFYMGMQGLGYDCATTTDTIHMNGPMHQACFDMLQFITGS